MLKDKHGRLGAGEREHGSEMLSLLDSATWEHTCRVCVCVCACLYTCVCVCVCVRQYYLVHNNLHTLVINICIHHRVCVCVRASVFFVCVCVCVQSFEDPELIFPQSKRPCFCYNISRVLTLPHLAVGDKYLRTCLFEINFSIT